MRPMQVVSLILAWIGLAGAAGAAEPPTYADVAPILAARCVLCHAGPGAPAQLALDSLEGVRRGSSSGPVVKPGDAAGSELIRRITGASQPRMPLTGPPFLSDDEIGLLERWVAGGLQEGTAPAAASQVPATPPRPAPGEPVTYAHVAPIFATRCVKCHTANGLMGPAPEGLQLNSYAATLASGERARVVPGVPAASELLRRVRGQARPVMPFDGPPYLDAEEIALIEAWIAQGARSADGQTAPLPVGARVRLHGRLGPDWRLDGLPLVVDRGTRIDKSPGVGDYVQVRGRVGSDGSIVAERIRRR